MVLLMDPKLFLRMVPVRVLTCLNQQNKAGYASMLAKEVDCAYAYLIKVLDELAAEELGNLWEKIFL